MTTPTINPIVHEMAVQAMRGAAREDRWDEPPVLALVMQDATLDPPILDLNIPDQMWAEAGHPVNAIDTITAGFLAGAIGLNLTEEDGTPIGLIFAVESYTTDSSNMTDQEFNELRQWMRTHDLRDHPTAQVHEARTLTAVDIDLNLVFLNHRRGEEPPTEPKYGDVTGRVPQAVTSLMAAIRDSQEVTA